jgi:hypothetical protein
VCSSNEMVDTATEAQTFSLQTPGMFFSMYSPPRSEISFRASRDRLEEDLRFTSKAVCNLDGLVEFFCLMTRDVDFKRLHYA